jgi:hypothetical protein
MTTESSQSTLPAAPAVASTTTTNNETSTSTTKTKPVNNAVSAIVIGMAGAGKTSVIQVNFFLIINSICVDFSLL